MKISELIKALSRLKVETGSLACFGCVHKDQCSIHGCAILKAAAKKLARLELIENPPIVEVHSKVTMEFDVHKKMLEEMRCEERETYIKKMLSDALIERIDKMELYMFGREENPNDGSVKYHLSLKVVPPEVGQI